MISPINVWDWSADSSGDTNETNLILPLGNSTASKYLLRPSVLLISNAFLTLSSALLRASPWRSVMIFVEAIKVPFLYLKLLSII